MTSRKTEHTPGAVYPCRGIPHGTKIVTRDVVGSALACSTDARGRRVVLVGAEVPRVKVDAYMRDVRRRLSAPAAEDPRPRPARVRTVAATRTDTGTADPRRSTLGLLTYPRVGVEPAARPAVLYLEGGERVDFDGPSVEAIARAIDAVRPHHWRPADGPTWANRETRTSITAGWRELHAAIGDAVRDGVPLRLLYEWQRGRRTHRAAVTVHVARVAPRHLAVRLARPADWTPRVAILSDGEGWTVRMVLWPAPAQRGETDDVTVRDLGTYDTRADADAAADAARRQGSQRAERDANRHREAERPAPSAPPARPPRHMPIWSELTGEQAAEARRIALAKVDPAALRSRLYTWGSVKPSGEVWYLEPRATGKGRWVRIDALPDWRPLVDAHRNGQAWREAERKLEAGRAAQDAWQQELSAIQGAAAMRARTQCARDYYGDVYDARLEDFARKRAAPCARLSTETERARCRDLQRESARDAFHAGVRDCERVAIDAGHAARLDAQRRAKETPRR